MTLLEEYHLLMRLQEVVVGDSLLLPQLRLRCLVLLGLLLCKKDGVLCGKDVDRFTRRTRMCNLLPWKRWHEICCFRGGVLLLLF